MGFAKLLKKKNLSEREKEEYLDIIISECERLSDLSSNVLNLSNVESMTVLTDTVSYNVSEQIRESILQLEQKWEEKQIPFHLDLVDCRYDLPIPIRLVSAEIFYDIFCCLISLFF